MKLTLPSTIFVTALLSAALPACAIGVPTDLLGDPAPPSSANYTITIHPDTKYVNVNQRDIVTFIVGSKNFTWSFFVAPTVSSFDLNQVAPGLLDHRVTAYIGPDPTYMHSGVL
jgi:hypothetical protein